LISKRKRNRQAEHVIIYRRLRRHGLYGSRGAMLVGIMFLLSSLHIAFSLARFGDCQRFIVSRNLLAEAQESRQALAKDGSLAIFVNKNCLFLMC
jgi:hypothetical protein